MAEPARGSADGPDPDDPERKPDPRASGWADVRRLVVTDSHAVALAVEDVKRAVEDVKRAVEELRHPAADPGKLDDAVEKLDAAVAMNGLTVGVMESAVVIAGRCEVGFAVIEEERARAYAQGVADCKAARCRLGVIGGGRDG